MPGTARIEVRTGVDFHEVRDELDFDQLVYTGPIDAYFDQRFGRLPYRSLRFDFETLPVERYQSTGTVNYPDELAVPFTRISEFKHMTGQVHPARADDAIAGINDADGQTASRSDV